MHFVLCCIFVYLRLGTAVLPRAVQATFPIIACDPGMRTWCSAVATNKSWPMRSGLQFETKTNYVLKGFDLWQWDDLRSLFCNAER